MIDEKELKESATKLLELCEFWEKLSNSEEISLKEILAVDLGMFVLNFSGDPKESFKKMTWFPDVKFEDEDLKQIFERISDSGKLWLKFGVDLPFLLQIIRTQWIFANELNRKILAETMEGVYEFFDLLGSWLLDETDKNQNREERIQKLEKTLMFMRNYIDKPR